MLREHRYFALYEPVTPRAAEQSNIDELYRRIY